MSTSEAAQRAAVLKAINDRVGAAFQSARVAANATMDPGDRKTARLDDGTKIGSVSMTDPQPKAAVTDEKAFLVWVLEHRPDEVVQVVRSAYKKRVLDVCDELGAPATRDGEVVDGVEFRPAKDPTVTVNQSEDEALAVAEAFASGDLAAILRGTPLGELEEPA